VINDRSTNQCHYKLTEFESLGTDEKAIISVLGHRTADQRVELITTYKTMFGKVGCDHVIGKCKLQFTFLQ
jgi:hypothetical protein